MIPAAALSQLSIESRRLTFVFTVRRDGKVWLVQDSHGALLALSPVKDVAIQSARRAAVLMSETGVRVIVMLENPLREFDAVHVAEPLPRAAPSALLS